MRKKWMSQILAGALVISAIAPMTVSASEDAAASDEPVTISFYTTVPDHDADFEKMCADFMEEHPNITVNYIAYDSSEKQKCMTLYASGEAPTVSLMDPIDIQENIANMAAYDPSTETWIDQLEDAYLDCFRSEDGQLYGVPNSVQAMGIIYNKTTIEKATGEEFDPSTITSSADRSSVCSRRYHLFKPAGNLYHVRYRRRQGWKHLCIQHASAVRLLVRERRCYAAVSGRTDGQRCGSRCNSGLLAGTVIR